MRNFEERMEEIQRRSEKIIKQRKKRRRYIAAVCVPAALCIAVVSAFALPRFMQESTMELNLHNGAATDNYQNFSQNGSFVEVSGNGMTITLSQPETVKQILQLMYAGEPDNNVLEQPEIIDDTENVYKEFLMDDSKDFSISSDCSSASVYTVTVHTASGETRYYELTGNQLKSGDSQEVRILTDHDLQELRNLLGITQEEGVK